MQPLIYDVAVSIDGFIADASNDVSKFPISGAIVDDYSNRLTTYAACLMGRRTYEFGYAFGLEPGQNPYPSMKSLVFSKSLVLPIGSDVETVSNTPLQRINTLQKNAAGPIYLCGGGNFAGWLLGHGMIDILRLKRAPILLGSGIPLFGSNQTGGTIQHIETIPYETGAVFQEYHLNRY